MSDLTNSLANTKVLLSPSSPLPTIVDCTGAGDTLVGAMVWSLTQQQQQRGEGEDAGDVWDDDECVFRALGVGTAAANLTIASTSPVAPELSSLPASL